MTYGRTDKVNYRVAYRTKNYLWVGGRVEEGRGRLLRGQTEQLRSRQRGHIADPAANPDVQVGFVGCPVQVVALDNQRIA